MKCEYDDIHLMKFDDIKCDQNGNKCTIMLRRTCIKCNKTEKICLNEKN